MKSFLMKDYSVFLGIVSLVSIAVGLIIGLFIHLDLPQDAGFVLFFFGLFLALLYKVSLRGKSIFLMIFAPLTGLFAFTPFLSNGTPTCNWQPMNPSLLCGVMINGVVPSGGYSYSGLIQWYDSLRFFAGMLFVGLIAGFFIYFMRISNVHKKGLLVPFFITGLITFALALILWWLSATTLPDPNPPPCPATVQCVSITVPIPNNPTSNILLLVTLVILFWPIVALWRLRSGPKSTPK